MKTKAEIEDVMRLLRLVAALTSDGSMAIVAGALGWAMGDDYTGFQAVVDGCRSDINAVKEQAIMAQRRQAN